MEQHPSADRLSGARILLVEDEALLAMSMEDDLAGAGAEIVGAAARCDEALALIDAAVRGGGLDAAVLDVNLAGEMVLPVADVLAERDIPFLFVTGYGTDFANDRHPAAPVLPKPFSEADLLGAVGAVVAECGQSTPVAD